MMNNPGIRISPIDRVVVIDKPKSTNSTAKTYSPEYIASVIKKSAVKMEDGYIFPLPQRLSNDEIDSLVLKSKDHIVPEIKALSGILRMSDDSTIMNALDEMTTQISTSPNHPIAKDVVDHV